MAYPKSDHFDGEKFFNPGESRERGFWDLLKWKFNSTPTKWPQYVLNTSYPKAPYTANNKGVFTFVNHATVLVQLEDLTILTDPVFSERVSPVKFAGPKRVRNPGITLDELPVIDVVVISHNHYDHLDLDSLKLIDKKHHPLFIVPLGIEKFLKDEGLQNVKELDWWDKLDVKSASIYLTPALHWSSRTPWDKFETLWGSYFVTSPKLSFYFGGDTGYSPHFKTIRERLGSPDVAIIPIGAYEPRWFMDLHHLNPLEAVKAHLDLGSKVSIPVHFGTFQLTDEGIDQPVEDLKKAMMEHNITSEQFRVLDFGESLIL